MSYSNRKRSSGRLSPFAQARSQANVLLEIAFSPDVPHFEAVRVGPRTMSVAEVRTELNAVRARVEVQLARPNMGADAVRERTNRAKQRDDEMPFGVMTGSVDNP